MATTRTQRLKRASSAEASGSVRADASEIVHTFADGWTIRRLVTCSDVRREAHLMRHCVSRFAAEAHVRHPLLGVSFEREADEAPAPRIDMDHMLARMMPGRYFGQHLYSLRDEQNLPHVTLWARIGDELMRGHACDVHGYRNAAPKASYAAKVGEWAAQVHVHMPVGDDDEHLLMLDGTHSFPGAMLGMRIAELLFEEADEERAYELARAAMIQLGRVDRARRRHLVLISARRSGRLSDAQLRRLPARRRQLRADERAGVRRIDLLWRQLLALSAKTHAAGLQRRRPTGRASITGQLRLRR
jgi:hypothetical protein